MQYKCPCNDPCKSEPPAHGFPRAAADCIGSSLTSPKLHSATFNLYSIFDFFINYEKTALQNSVLCPLNFPNGNLKQQWSHIGVFICYQNIVAKNKNELNLHIYGIHLLNPYKTVVSHLNTFFSSSSLTKGL